MRVFIIVISFFLLGFSASALELDTNKTDAQNMKQGLWIYYGKMVNIKGYKSNAVYESGKFLNDKKEGEWVRYYPNGKPLSKISYEHNRPEGPYTTYYDNGKVQEEGMWKNRRNVGTFKRFHPNGVIAQEKIFSETGKSNGVQKYYFDNGKVELEFKTTEGKEDGEMVRYYEDGSVKEKKSFNGGVVDEKTVQKFKPPKPELETEEIEIEEDAKEPPVVNQKVEKTNIGILKDGPNKVYNRNKQLYQDGMFKNGRLKSGKVFNYDENGILISIDVYKRFKFVGNAPITADDK